MHPNSDASLYLTVVASVGPADSRRIDGGLSGSYKAVCTESDASGGGIHCVAREGLEVKSEGQGTKCIQLSTI